MVTDSLRCSIRGGARRAEIGDRGEPWLTRAGQDVSHNEWLDAAISCPSRSRSEAATNLRHATHKVRLTRSHRTSAKARCATATMGNARPAIAGEHEGLLFRDPWPQCRPVAPMLRRPPCRFQAVRAWKSWRRSLQANDAHPGLKPASASACASSCRTPTSARSV